MRHPLPCPVMELKKHRVCNVQPGQFIQSAWRHEDLSAMVYVLAFGAGHHGNRVASVVFVEATIRSSRTEHGGA